VLKHLRQHPKRWYRTAEIVRAVGRSQKTVSWALHYLRTLGHIEATPCGGPSVCCRYLRYRAVLCADPQLRQKEHDERH
jgi:hypothetical protein